jgi:hypothetical protein
MPGTDPEDAAPSRAEAREGEDPRALVAVRGPGGFPLLGAPAIGNWRRTSTAVAAVPAEPASPDRDDPSAGDRLAARDLAAQAAGPDRPGDGETAADADATRPGSWARSRVTLSFGLSMATALTLNVVLSDPVAGFDYLATRLDRDARKLGRTRRPPSHPRG